MKKHIIIVTAFVILAGGLGALAFLKYQSQPKGITLQQAVSQRDAALSDLHIAKRLDSVHQTAANKTITDLQEANNGLTAKNTTLCTQIKAAKLVQPLCK